MILMRPLAGETNGIGVSDYGGRVLLLDFFFLVEQRSLREEAWRYSTSFRCQRRLKYLDRASYFFLYIYILVNEYTTSRWYSPLAFDMTILSRAVMQPHLFLRHDLPPML